MKAYKAFDQDMRCRGYQYEVGKTYKHDGGIDICKAGFHACEIISDCFDFYSFSDKTRIAEVELLGEIKTDGKKSVCSEISIIRELPWPSILAVANNGKNNTGNRNTGDMNTGNMNTGNMNTGDRNTGDRNTGYRNTGDMNTGNMNTGDWNGCNFETGFFNPESKPIKSVRVFGSNIVDRIGFINSTGYKICSKFEILFYRKNGKRHPIPYKLCWDHWQSKLTRKEKVLVASMPGFNADVFFEITGIDWRKKNV